MVANVNKIEVIGMIKACMSSDWDKVNKLLDTTQVIVPNRDFEEQQRPASNGS